MERQRMTFYVDPDVAADLRIAAAAEKAKAAKEGRKVRDADGISDIANRGIRRELDRRTKKSK